MPHFSLEIIQSLGLISVDALEVTLETILSNGRSVFSIVGLPENAIKESNERIRSAIINSGANFLTRCITVTLLSPIYPRQVAGTISILPYASPSPPDS